VQDPGLAAAVADPRGESLHRLRHRPGLGQQADRALQVDRA
jgi:hypothetical protein